MVDCRRIAVEMDGQREGGDVREGSGKEALGLGGERLRGVP